MVTLSKLQRNTQEFIREGKLHEYSDEVTAIIKKIDLEGCGISCHYLSEPSSHSFGPEGCYIRIAMMNKLQPMHVVWDLLHEYGHFLSGPPITKGPELEREILAWAFAEKELELYPRLKLFSANFNAYREECLIGYRKFDAIGRK